MENAKKNNEYYEKIKTNKIGTFENISNKNDLFDLFVIINRDVFTKAYYDSTFLSFLKNNEDVIKQNFGDNTKYNEILEINENKEIGKKKEELLSVVKNDLNGDKLYTIIDSFFYLLFYKFKDTKEIKGRTNLGNVYINTILTKFVNFLAANSDNSKNVIESLYELYAFDLKDAKYKENEKIETEYYFSDIEKLLSSCGKNLTAKLELDRRSYSDTIQKNFGLFESLSQRVCENYVFSYLLLKGIDSKITSNTITIIVDILHKEDNEKDWTKFTKYFKNKTMFYFFKWPLETKNEFLKKEKMTDSAKNLSKDSGKILADILISNKVFNNFQINLVGYNLGANVVKHCIKELNKINGKKNFTKFKNVILIGAATHLKDEDKWKDIIKNNVIDRFINCYSGCDETLKDLYSKIKKTNKTKKSPLGITPLELKDEKGNNLIENFNFTDEKYDQTSYDFENVAQKVFPNSKAL
jgi:hypothetical protein